MAPGRGSLGSSGGSSASAAAGGARSSAGGARSSSAGGGSGGTPTRTATVLYVVLAAATIVSCGINLLHHRLGIAGGDGGLGGVGGGDGAGSAAADFLRNFVRVGPGRSRSRGTPSDGGRGDLGGTGAVRRDADGAGDEQRSDGVASVGAGAGAGGQTHAKNAANNAGSNAHRLSCTKYGGPPDGDPVLDEMTYWSDIPVDAKFVSPLKDRTTEQYMTFEPDHGGWNNIRMAMETILVMAHATGRTLVLPPENRMYLLGKNLDFDDFFHLRALSDEHDGINIITMKEFLEREGVTGRLVDPDTKQPMKPPDDRVDWDNANLGPLWSYLRTVGNVPKWNPNDCLAAFPATTDPADVDKLKRMMEDIRKEGKPPDPFKAYVGEPVPVDAPPIDRLRENLAGRTELCVYDEELRSSPLVHFMVDQTTHVRYLIHFYSFVFFEDWRQDLWTKRFIRDHIRYLDEIMCAGARIVSAVRDRARGRDPGGNPDGLFDSFHVRRGDFQYKKTRVDADVLYEKSKDELEEGSTLYIGTDERDKNFFKPLAEHHDLCYLDDFKHLIKGIDSNYFGMIDQVVASKGRVYFGTWFSSFSGYINRMRGYYISKHKLEGYKDGTMKSWYFVPDDRKYEMQQYRASRKPFYMREFPTSWRDIDRAIEELSVKEART